MISPAVMLALLLVGLVVGFTAGLIGIGGGVLIVPFLYFFYGHPAWSGVLVPGELHTNIAHATSLFIIIPTAALGVRNYQKAKLVEWRAAIPVGIAAALAAVAGAYLAVLLREELLRFGFGMVLLWCGLQLTRGRKEVADAPLRLGAGRVILTGVVVGLLSGMMGIGGGMVAMPMLIYLIHLEFRKTAATSLAIVGFAALAGTFTNMLYGLSIGGMPPGSVGYVHLLAALPILIGSMFTVRWGTVVNQRMKSRTLRLLFAVLFSLMGLQLIAQNAREVF